MVTMTVENPATVKDERVPDTRDDENFLTPPVDIYENEAGMTVVVDLPGVNEKDVDVRVENDVLSIQARSAYRAPDNLLYSEFSLAGYFRQFRLSDEVDRGRISASMRHGVLTLQLPKAERAKPRRIRIEVGS